MEESEEAVIVEKPKGQHFSRQDPSIASPPVDFSFQKIKTMENLLDHTPRRLRVGCPSKDPENNKYITRAIWMNNNELTLLTGLIELSQFFPNLSWLDLSYNKITNIPYEIIFLDRLSILYLHENKISDITEVSFLSKLIFLRSLTLLRNEIAQIQGYKHIIALAIPHLKKLDFCVLTKKDRDVDPANYAIH